MSESSFAVLYEEMLAEVGAKAAALGDRPIASHWPFVGSSFSGTLIVGQALAGWDAESTGARWIASEASTPADRQRILEESRAWARARAEPMEEVMRWGHRRRSPFWGLSRRIMQILEPEAEPWYSRHGWWNVYPLGWDRPGASPGPKLRAVQETHVGELFWSVVDELKVERVILTSGADWWPDVRQRLGLSSLDRRSLPVLAAGRCRGIAIVATYHPGAHMKGITRDAFAKVVADELRDLEERGPETRSV